MRGAVSCFLFLFSLFISTVLAGGPLIHPALAEAPSTTLPLCKGVNLIEKLKAEKPDEHKALLEGAASEINSNGVFWKITEPDGHVSYLLGTMHTTDPQVTNLPDSARVALKQSKRVLVEVANLSPQAVAGVMGKRPDLFFSLQGNRLNTMLSETDYKVVVEAAQKAGMPGHMVPVLKPWFASVSFFAVPNCEKLRLNAKEPVLDKLVETWGKETGAEIVGLETLEEQFAAFNSIPLNDQITLVENGVHTKDLAQDIYSTTIDLYKNRQLGLIMPLSLLYVRDRVKSLSANASFKAILINKRNRTMHERALPHVQKGGAFIAVGALHLTGQVGLVELFRQSGFQVEKVF